MRATYWSNSEASKLGELLHSLVWKDVLNTVGDSSSWAFEGASGLFGVNGGWLEVALSVVETMEIDNWRMIIINEYNKCVIFNLTLPSPLSHFLFHSLLLPHDSNLVFYLGHTMVINQFMESEGEYNSNSSKRRETLMFTFDGNERQLTLCLFCLIPLSLFLSFLLNVDWCFSRFVFCWCLCPDGLTKD